MKVLQAVYSFLNFSLGFFLLVSLPQARASAQVTCSHLFEESIDVKDYIGKKIDFLKALELLEKFAPDELSLQVQKIQSAADKYPGQTLVEPIWPFGNSIKNGWHPISMIRNQDFQRHQKVRWKNIDVKNEIDLLKVFNQITDLVVAENINMNLTRLKQFLAFDVPKQKLILVATTKAAFLARAEIQEKFHWTRWLPLKWFKARNIQLSEKLLGLYKSGDYEAFQSAVVQFYGLRLGTTLSMEIFGKSIKYISSISLMYAYYLLHQSQDYFDEKLQFETELKPEDERIMQEIIDHSMNEDEDTLNEELQKLMK